MGKLGLGVGLLLSVLCLVTVSAPAAAEFPICTAPEDQSLPAIWGDVVVWEDCRNTPYQGAGIYGYHLSTHQEFPICTEGSGHCHADVSGNIVVWKDWRSGELDIYGYDLSTGEEFPVCTGVYRAHHPAVSGDTVVWQDCRDYYPPTIYGYSLSAGEEFPVRPASWAECAPDISGNTVVWSDARDDPTSGTDIYGYDLSTDQEFPICTAPDNQSQPAVSGNLAVWYDCRGTSYPDIYGYDLSTGQEFPVSTDLSCRVYPAISGGIAVWQDGRNSGSTGFDIYGGLLPPSPPSGLVATAVSATQVNLTWTDNSDFEEGFKVYRKKAGGSWETPVTLPTPDLNHYEFTNCQDYSTYYFAVRAYCGSTDSANSNLATATTPLAAPTSLSATAASPTRVNLTWTDNSTGEQGFKVYRKKSGGAWEAPVTLPTPDLTHYEFTNCLPGTTYYFAVRAYCGSATSSNSNLASATTPNLLAPSNLTAAAVAWNRVNLTWVDHATGEQGFKVYRKKLGGSWEAPITLPTPNLTHYEYGSCQDNTTYYFAVRAYYGATTSPNSNLATATTPPAPPSNLVATAVSCNQINLTWVDNATGEQGFKVYRKKLGGSWESPITLPTPNLNHYEYAGCEATITYYFAVRSYYGSTTSPNSNLATATTPACP